MKNLLLAIASTALLNTACQAAAHRAGALALRAATARTALAIRHTASTTHPQTPYRARIALTPSKIPGDKQEAKTIQLFLAHIYNDHFNGHKTPAALHEQLMVIVTTFRDFIHAHGSEKLTEELVPFIKHDDNTFIAEAIMACHNHAARHHDATFAAFCTRFVAEYRPRDHSAPW